MYYRRDGTPYPSRRWPTDRPVLQWAKDMKVDKIRRVAETTLPDGKWISTVWVGLDHNFGSGKPLIFETMVFPSHGDWSELDCERYSTEQEAIAGHEAMVKKWSAPQCP